MILQHHALRGLSQGVAEEYYILAGQQLEGYGQQSFAAKVGIISHKIVSKEALKYIKLI